MAYKVIILYQLYMPSYFLGTFTEYPYCNNNTKIYDKYNRYHSVRPHNFPLYPPYSFSKAYNQLFFFRR